MKGSLSIMNDPTGLIKKVFATILIMFSLLAGFYALTKYFTTREIHDIAFAQQAKDLSSHKKSDRVNSAQQQINFLQNQETLLKRELRYTTDLIEKTEIQEDLEDVKQQKRDSQKFLKELKK